jgi:hypothetical protein
MIASSWFIASTTVMITIMPLMLCVLAPVAIVYYKLQLYYRRTSVDLQVSSVSVSVSIPVFSITLTSTQPAETRQHHEGAGLEPNCGTGGGARDNQGKREGGVVPWEVRKQR